MDRGPVIELDERPSQGTRHEVVFGVLVGSGERVAVKLERTAGGLARERAALACLGSRDGQVPRLIAAGAATVDTEPVECVVTERRSGAAPTSIEGWRRMGRAYARLAGSHDLALALPALDRTQFGAQHAQRVRDLGDLIAPFAVAGPEWDRLCSEQVPGSPPLVITHGDPGPGNFLDDGGTGTIIDWEDAHIAPRGLDLARLVFIALLGAGPAGYVARDRHARARAARDGYLEAIGDGWQPSREEWRWWLTAAGIQFIHRRWSLGGQPAPWQDAAALLAAVLGH